MPFGLVGGVVRGIGVLYWGRDRRREGQFWDKCGASHFNEWGRCGIVIPCVRGGDAALPKLLRDFLFSFRLECCAPVEPNSGDAIQRTNSLCRIRVHSYRIQ